MINHFISLMECLSDFNYISKNEDNPKVVTTLKGMVDLIGDFYIILLTLSNFNEVIRMFELHSREEFERPSLHCFINSTLTKFFQILCEGNQVELKKHLNKFSFSPKDPAKEEKKEYARINKIALPEDQSKKKKSKQSKGDKRKKDQVIVEINEPKKPDNAQQGNMRLSKVFTKLKKGGDGVDISPDSNKTYQLLSFLNIISANMRLLISQGVDR